MTADELANQSLMTENDAQKILDYVDGMAFWSNPENIISLSIHGFDVDTIIEKIEDDPLYLLTYLAIHDKP
jgi:hypothetical protein